MKLRETKMVEQFYKYRTPAAGPPRSVDGILLRQPQYIRRSAAVQPRRRPLVAQVAPPVSKLSASTLVAPQRPTASAAVARPRKWKLGLIAGALALFGGFLVFGHFDGSSAKHRISHLSGIQHVAAEAKSLVRVGSTPATPTPNAQLASDMIAALATQPGLQSAATLIDLNTGLTYSAGTSTSLFTTASTGKLISVFDYLHQVELGKTSLTQTIGGDSAQNIIRRMIIYSDNNAWAALNSYLTLPQEQSYMNSLGITASIKPENWQITPVGMAHLLQLLYQGKLMNTSHQALVYSYMSHTTVTNLIQAAVPTGATVYHKYGQILGDLHDASIIEYQGHNFVLVIYTNNPDGTSNKYSNQVQLIHSVAAAAFSDVTKT